MKCPWTHRHNGVFASSRLKWQICFFCTDTQNRKTNKKLRAYAEQSFIFRNLLSVDLEANMQICFLYKFDSHDT